MAWVGKKAGPPGAQRALDGLLASPPATARLIAFDQLMDANDMKAPLSFSDATVEQLEAMEGWSIDSLPFGVVGLNSDGLVAIYNKTETALAGLSPAKVLGRHFFRTVAPCMNNFMVAQRFEDEPTLDETLNYVLTFRMRPKAVRLRLLQQPGYRLRYILIQA